MTSAPLGPGDSAPDFALPAVNREGQVSLDDYRGRSPVLVGKVNPTGELPEALPEPEAAAELNRREGFQPTEIDQQIEAAHGTQLAGHFLMDREGIIRWRQIEAAERIDDLGKFPSDEEILRAARGL